MALVGRLLIAPSYLKSPSWYLSKAWRMMVIKAMTGFTMQNCSVAWGGRRKGVGLGWSGDKGTQVGRAGPLTCLQKRKKVME